MSENRSRVPASGRESLESFAPAQARALDALEAAAWRALEETGREAVGVRALRLVAAQHGLEPLAPPRSFSSAPGSADPTRWRDDLAPDDPDRAALAFAEQMGFDVASLQDAERQALFAALGADAGPFAQAVYVGDLLPRARAALDALFGPTPSWAPSAPPSDAPELAEGAALQAAFDELIRRVPQLQALDPVSTELLRLLGARRHRCRICQSLRSRSALVAGADEALFREIDEHAAAGSRLSEAHRALLAFADAVLLPPARVDAATAERLRAAYSPEACVEVVLDLVRNAANKVAVALAADAPNVESGVEIYDVGPDGELLYGLEAP